MIPTINKSSMNCCTELNDEPFSIFSSWTKMTLLMVQQGEQSDFSHISSSKSGLKQC